MNEPSFGARLRAAREANKKTLEGLAAEVGSTKSYVWELENKPDVRPSADLVYRIAKALGITVEDLLTGKKPKDAATQVFFREYEKLSDKSKKKLMTIAKLLQDE